MSMGVLAIAAYVKGPGLGNLIFAGLARVGSPTALPMALTGTLLIVILALLLDAALVPDCITKPGATAGVVLGTSQTQGTRRRVAT